MPRYLTVLSISVMSEQELDGPEISKIRKCEQCIEKVSQEERDRPSGSLSIKMK
jgi:hypothetical protein